jgi:hypothetical protein
MVPALNSPEILVRNAEAREPAPAEPGEAVPRPWAPCTLWIRGFHLSLPLLRGTPARAGGTESKSILKGMGRIAGRFAPSTGPIHRWLQSIRATDPCPPTIGTDRSLIDGDHENDAMG